MSDYTIVPIESSEEAKSVKALARRVFGAGGSVLLPRKRPWGFYAHHDGNVVGGHISTRSVGRRGCFPGSLSTPRHRATKSAGG